MNLAGGCVRSQEYTRTRGVKGVPHITRWVVWWDIQQFEVGFIIFNFTRDNYLKATPGK